MDVDWLAWLDEIKKKNPETNLYFIYIKWGSFTKASIIRK